MAFLTVLEKAIRNDLRRDAQTELVNALYAVLGTVVAVATPVNRHSLSILADVCPDLVNKVLQGLHSIFAIPDNVLQPIRMHHASFCQFVLDPYRCSDVHFLVNGSQQHKTLAERCFSLMAEHLCNDICDFRDPSARLSAIDHDEVERPLAPLLQYACRFWSYHTQFVDDEFELTRTIFAFLHNYVLHWLEALCLL